MGLKNDLADKVEEIFREQWSTRDGLVVPDPDDLRLANDAVELDNATVLYADLAESTAMVNTKRWAFAAEIYKTYLHCAAKIINAEGGEITSYDGDRVMAMWIEDDQWDRGARCGLKINHAVSKIINPAIKECYPKSTFRVRHVVGVDTSDIRAVRIGVRGGNDIVWVGRAANYAAKLTNLKMNERTFITDEVFKKLTKKVKYGGEDSELMWKAYKWPQQDDHRIHGSTWRWPV